MKGFRLRSLRVRLTLWYSAALISVALLLAFASRWAMAVSLDHALDQSLRFRMIGLHGFIDENSHEGLERLGVRLRELNHLGELFQVFGPNGELMAQSDGLTRHHVGGQPPPDPGAGMLFHNAGAPQFPMRVATQRIYVDGKPLTIEVADPQVKFHNLLTEFNSMLLLALPFALALAALGGYWLSGRALKPVDQIIDEARSMNPVNLAARLSVPASGDELQRLSETLNQMLDRVEQSLRQVQQFTADASHELRAPLTLIYTAAQFALRRDRSPVEMKDSLAKILRAAERSTELRAPLTLIYTAAQFALRRDRSPVEMKDSLEKILRAATRSTELINELLWLARSDAGGHSLNTVVVDLRRLVEEVIGDADVMASEEGLKVCAELPEEEVRAEVDEDSFRRMLVILLDNALKYTPAGGHVTVAVRPSGTSAVIQVTDTGSGISDEDLPFIFDRFWRADKVRSRETGGMGLGLAIAREIAQAHGAKLTVSSVAGQGSTFTVEMPRSWAIAPGA